MKYQILFFIMLFSIIANGQITIDQSDMPQPEDVFTYSTGNASNQTPELTGENFLWDYSDLTMITQDVDSFVNVDDTPFLYQFFFNNGFLYPDHQADVALAGEDIDLLTVSATNIYNYYKYDTEGYRIVGLGATISGLPQSIQYDPIEWIYEFPLTYGDDFGGASYIEFTLPGLGFVSQDKQTMTEVDGWGNLSLPIGDFDVLRVKKTINATDSVYSENLGIGFLIPQPEEIKYQWLASGEIEPILEISTFNGVVASTRYKDDIISSIPAFSKKDITFYPNPANDLINVNLASSIMPEFVKVFDAIGREVKCPLTMVPYSVIINVQSLANGYYFLQIETAGVRHVERFVIQ